MGAEPKRERILQRALLAMVLALALMALSGGLYTLASGKPPSIGMFIGPILITVFLSTWSVAALNRVKLSQVPEPLAAMLRRELDIAGLKDVRLIYLDKGQRANFPRPLATRQTVSLSKTVCEAFTPEALAWSVKTEAFAAALLAYRVLLPLVALLLGLGVGSGLCERWKPSPVYVASGASLFVLAFVALCVTGYRYQFEVDRRFTVTDLDRCAAKEALSYPYFSQLDRPTSDRWLFLKSELARRVRKLGIELERGYRCPAEAPPP